MHCIRHGQTNGRRFIKLGCWGLLLAMVILVSPAWSADTQKTEKELIFKTLYYDQVTGLGIIQDTKGTAIGVKDALFRIHIKENGKHKIFYIEAYPETLSLPGTHIDEFPVDIITMLIKTYPKYNLS